MPHFHLLLILDEESQITTPDQVDDYICARVPPIPMLNDLSVAANQQRRLWHHVTTMMIHDCNPACKGFRNGETVCNKNFPKPYSEMTELSGTIYLNTFC